MGDEYTEEERERMAKLEIRLENIELVVTRMDLKMDAWQANFVSKELLEEKLKLQNKEIERLQNELERLDNERKSYKSSLPLWAAAFIAAISLLVSLWRM